MLVDVVYGLPRTFWYEDRGIVFPSSQNLEDKDVTPWQEDLLPTVSFGVLLDSSPCILDDRDFFWLEITQRRH